MEIKGISLRVYGRVQGVFYRQSTRTKAEELGIKGFVRNEADGSVYIEAQGSEVALAQFTGWCRRGPLGAKVEKLVIAETATEVYPEFTIRR